MEQAEKQTVVLLGAAFQYGGYWWAVVCDVNKKPLMVEGPCQDEPAAVEAAKRTLKGITSRLKDRLGGNVSVDMKRATPEQVEEYTREARARASIQEARLRN